MDGGDGGGDACPSLYEPEGLIEWLRDQIRDGAADGGGWALCASNPEAETVRDFSHRLYGLEVSSTAPTLNSPFDFS